MQIGEKNLLFPTPIIMNNIDRFYTKDAAIFADSYIKYLQSVLNRIDTTQIANFIEAVLDARARGSAIFFIGNGGSAATASHFANDMAIGTGDYVKPLRAISLTDNVPVLTAIGNDFGYQEIFVRQLRVIGQEGDILVGISASGNSANIISAFEYAATAGIKTVAITAFDGGQMKRLGDLSVHVPTESKEYGPAEDAHMMLDHLVGAYLMRYVQTG
jgi:D-sedoheptulose 7-phosphate isomerase